MLWRVFCLPFNDGNCWSIRLTIHYPRLANDSVATKLLPAPRKIPGRTLMNDSGLISIWRQVIWIV